MKTSARRLSQALRRNPLAVDRLIGRWIRQGRTDAITEMANALPKRARANFLRRADFSACVAPLLSEDGVEGYGWLLAFSTLGAPDRQALARALEESADPRIWSLVLAPHPWDAAALRMAGHSTWRAALEALLDNREMPPPVLPSRRWIWLLAFAGPAADDLPFPGADVWGPGGLSQRRLSQILDRLSHAAGVPVLPPPPSCLTSSTGPPRRTPSTPLPTPRWPVQRTDKSISARPPPLRPF